MSVSNIDKEMLLQKNFPFHHVLESSYYTPRMQVIEERPPLMRTFSVNINSPPERPLMRRTRSAIFGLEPFSIAAVANKKKTRRISL